jgi:hypothetical protein
VADAFIRQERLLSVEFSTDYNELVRLPKLTETKELTVNAQFAYSWFANSRR